MTPAVLKSAARMFLALTFLLANPGLARSQDPSAASTVQNQKKRLDENNAKKAAEQEEKALREAAEKERKEAEAAAKEREKTTARLVTAEPQAKVERPIASVQAPTRAQERIQQAEAKARIEAEKARKREEDRARAQEAKDAEQRRKDEERAGREAAKARESQDRTRAASLQKEHEQAEKAPSRREGGAPAETAAKSGAPSRPNPVPSPASAPPPGKADARPRKELVRQIEKARAERDRLSREADEAERLARAARAAANEGQRAYEAMTTGLGIEDVAVPAAPPPADGAPRKNRFLTKADEKQAAALKNAPQNDCGSASNRPRSQESRCRGEGKGGLRPGHSGAGRSARHPGVDGGARRCGSRGPSGRGPGPGSDRTRRLGGLRTSDRGTHRPRSRGQERRAGGSARNSGPLGSGLANAREGR